MSTSIETLPFVATCNVEGGKKINTWSPARSGDYEKDCATGRAYYREMEQFMQESGATLILPRVLQAQIIAGIWNGVEVGFAHAMAEAIVRRAKSTAVGSSHG